MMMMMMTTTRRRLLPALLLVTAFVARTLAFQSGVCSHQQLMQRTRPLSSTQRIVREQDATVFRRSALASQDGQEAVHTKQEVAVGYNRGKIVFGATAATVLVLPDCTNSALLASKVGGAAGFAVASGLCHILQGANENDRLGSDTYKRLNLGLLGFGVLGLAAVPGEAGFCTTAAPAMFLTVVLSAVRMFGAKVAWNGWERGVNPRDGRTNVLTELVQGTQSTLQGLKVQNRKKALSYANLLLLVGLGIVSSFMDGLFNIRYLKTFHKSYFDVSLKWSAVSRLFMLSTMIFSLKDAAERDRLAGTTFIQMNVMVGLWAVLVGLAMSTQAGAKKGVEMYAFSLPFFIKAFKSQKEKQEKEKKSPDSS